jgi:hypothetical protein
MNQVAVSTDADCFDKTSPGQNTTAGGARFLCRVSCSNRSPLGDCNCARVQLLALPESTSVGLLADNDPETATEFCSLEFSSIVESRTPLPRPARLDHHLLDDDDELTADFVEAVEGLFADSRTRASNREIRWVDGADFRRISAISAVASRATGK